VVRYLDTVYVEGIAFSGSAGDVSIALEVDSDDLPDICTNDAVNATILQGGLTALRPTTPPFQPTEVEDGFEAPGADPTAQIGAGIRFNGDDDNNNTVPDHAELPVAGEDDLIRMSIAGQSKFIIPETHEWVLRRSNSAIQAWLTPEKNFEEVFGDEEAGVVEFFDHFIEWVDPAINTVTLELGIREVDTGIITVTDIVSLYRFQGVVIALGGNGQDPNDPPNNPANHGVFMLAIELYHEGYDVHMYNEEVGVDADNGGGAAYDEVLSAVQDRVVNDVAIYGYSHGGGATYNLASDLTAANISIDFTAYIDAVTQGGTSQETGLPLGTGFHANYYQPNGALELGGGPVAGANLE